jgi:hypothetical protein
MGTTDKIIEFFINNRVEEFRIKDIIQYTNLRYMQVAWVIHYWKRYGKIEKVKEVRNTNGSRKYTIYRLKTAGKKYINAKANMLIYAV